MVHVDRERLADGDKTLLTEAAFLETDGVRGPGALTTAMRCRANHPLTGAGLLPAAVHYRLLLCEANLVIKELRIDTFTEDNDLPVPGSRDDPPAVALSRAHTSGAGSPFALHQSYKANRIDSGYTDQTGSGSRAERERWEQASGGRHGGHGRADS